jgi:uroporphyrinogen-III decarboxylase
MGMTNRERFFAVMENETPDRVPFFPDITDWYKARRTGKGEPQRFATGQIIFDDDSFHSEQVDMPARFRDFTLLDFHRRFDWGCPIHAYQALSVQHEGVTIREHREGRERRQVIETPCGALDTAWGMAPYGSESVVRYPVQGPEDVPAMEYYARQTRCRGDADAVHEVLDALGDLGVIDLPIGRTPFGLLVQELMGYEALAYALADDPGVVHRLMDALSEGFWERVEIAAGLPGRIVIITDHADENLISPRWFREYCLPYYQEAARRLHAAGKLVSTHLDGNIRGLIDQLPEAGFDLLDGCTPAPMGNYEPEDLARALGPNLKAYCGVPSTLFCTHTPTEQILDYGRRIIDALGPNVIVNVGDVLPPDGDIEQVIALGEAVAG